MLSIRSGPQYVVQGSQISLHEENIKLNIFTSNKLIPAIWAGGLQVVLWASQHLAVSTQEHKKKYWKLQLNLDSLAFPS